MLARVTDALCIETCWHHDRLRLPVSAILNGRKGKRRRARRNGRKRRKEEAEEKEGEIDMTNTAWGQRQQPDRVDSIGETKLKTLLKLALRSTALAPSFFLPSAYH